MEGLCGITIIGVYPVDANEDLVEETVKIRWGYDLLAADSARAKQNIRDEFSQLFLIEIQTDPSDARFDWLDITQVIVDEPRANWQVPYDEQPVDGMAGRWVFFFHFLKLDEPLRTPVGDIRIPGPTKRPDYLAAYLYDSP